jgi:hypothetical protein
MKAILIAPDHAKRTTTVSTVEVAEDDIGDASLESLYSILQCQEIEVVDCDPTGALQGHCAIVDENGLTADNPGYTWCPQIGLQPLAGRILLMRTNSDGFMVEAQVSEASVRSLPGLAYLIPSMAARFAHRFEEQVINAYPGAILVKASDFIDEQIARAVSKGQTNSHL